MAQDIAPQSFWDKIPALKPFAMLARWDRPVGVWLLYWPSVWGMTLAPSFADLAPESQACFLLLFFVGAVAMRGAGCTVNDLIDRKLDAQVTRTKMRPLASGAVSVKAAIVFIVLQIAVGAAVLLQLHPLAIYLGLATLPLIGLYPYMKRITWWPQAFLGIVFNSGALIGWAAVEDSLGYPALLLYAAGFFWTLAYDTVYAFLDAEDDALIGIKSTALRWGPDAKLLVGVCFLLCVVCFAGALMSAKVQAVAYIMLAIVAIIMMIGHAFWNTEKKEYSLGFFRLQAQVGFLLALATLGSVIF